MQVGVSMPGETPPTVSEDCLYLKIWTPAKTAHAQLPVIVWIYGGGYINGSAAMPLYWGDQLAHKGVIVVTVAYRLGPLGFLALPELTRESPHHSSGNYGLMDQIAALEWIQRNIAAFGGDPKCVTIAGQSSGSMSVSILMASPLARGLFQRNTRVHFIQPLKERIVREVGYGLSLEGASAADLVKSMQAKSEPVARKGKPREAH
jgi:para-nitrobenzyl esterase